MHLDEALLDPLRAAPFLRVGPRVAAVGIVGHDVAAERRGLARRAGVVPLPLTGQVPCYNVYRVADGYLTVAALEADFWKEFCGVIDRADLISRQFDPSAVGEVQAILKPGSRAEWMARFGDRDVCVEPMRALDELNGD